ncbi:u4 u6 small nuclear ribonucleoprotein prp3 [Colletotrichum karsti]|uniref:U4 u6 small nuclear ribonucleoprotein prp3 n=1 Tax=Colletotrichum karsti TaxID=1095194 RepID=A0A9P6HX00_9PEZI|nr:u4 u6 small nuclear ribonucleoprotein prp3 [Colletotrichum karsti]KAF9870551.1 u4 u6 small nuclear ribonucleoprotein prp3 [Colletotrichum karsti]
MDRDRRSDSNGLGPRHDPSSRVHKTESTADKMAALKARVAAAIGGSKANGGAETGLHPALQGLGQNTSSSRPSAPSFRSQFDSSSISAPGSRLSATPGRGHDDAQANPYFNEQQAAQPPGGRQRQSRPLNFHAKGKFIQQGNAMRRQAALEELKKKIAAQTRKAGIEEELDMEKNLVVEAPPDIEWFDEGLVDGGNYDNIDDVSRLKINTEDTIVTEYVQHPVALEPPQERNKPAPKPMYTTAKEKAKVRRQRRKAELKEHQAKIRLGFLPPPPPKVKKSNMMRVYADSAVKDPTAVENLVNRQIAERQQQHLEANEERKLTKEEKHDKLAANQEKDAAKGIHVLVFKINSLANGQHRFKIGKNAEQHSLTGVCIMHPKMNLVIVEGGEHSIGKYKKLMLNRIDWTENSPSREGGSQKLARDWLLSENEKGELRDMSQNECKLVFEGEEKTRSFRKWGSKVCESDAEAKDVLARAKMDNFWALAKNA